MPICSSTHSPTEDSKFDPQKCFVLLSVIMLVTTNLNEVYFLKTEMEQNNLIHSHVIMFPK